MYIPDLLAVASFYKDWGAIGGTSNFLAYGDFPQSEKEPESLFMPRGIVTNRSMSGVKPVDPQKITEHVARSWYEGSADKHPYQGETKPIQADPQYDTKSDNGRYTWLKAPRYDGNACEVGPLARVLVAYGYGHKQIAPVVDKVVNTLGVNAPSDRRGHAGLGHGAGRESQKRGRQDLCIVRDAGQVPGHGAE